MRASLEQKNDTLRGVFDSCLSFLLWKWISSDPYPGDYPIIYGEEIQFSHDVLVKTGGSHLLCHFVGSHLHLSLCPTSTGHILGTIRCLPLPGHSRSVSTGEASQPHMGKYLRRSSIRIGWLTIRFGTVDDKRSCQAEATSITILGSAMGHHSGGYREDDKRTLICINQVRMTGETKNLSATSLSGNASSGSSEVGFLYSKRHRITILGSAMP